MLTSLTFFNILNISTCFCSFVRHFQTHTTVALLGLFFLTLPYRFFVFIIKTHVLLSISLPLPFLPLPFPLFSPIFSYFLLFSSKLRFPETLVVRFLNKFFFTLPTALFCHLHASLYISHLKSLVCPSIFAKQLHKDGGPFVQRMSKWMVQRYV